MVGLSVSATETAAMCVPISWSKPSYGLGDGEIASMLQSAFCRGRHDMQARAPPRHASMPRR